MKNCDRGLESAARGCTFSSPRSQFFHYTDRPEAGKKLIYFFQALKRKKTSRKKTHASVNVTVVRDRKIRTALRTNQIEEFVTVSAWKKIIPNIWRESNLGYLCDICSKKRTVFRDRSSTKTLSFEEQIMTKDKYASIF